MWTTIILFISSFPIHVVYNSTVVVSVVSQDFVAVTVDQSFTTGGTWDASIPLLVWDQTNLIPTFDSTEQTKLEQVAKTL